MESRTSIMGKNKELEQRFREYMRKKKEYGASVRRLEASMRAHARYMDAPPEEQEAMRQDHQGS